jgi:hypothetical protein
MGDAPVATPRVCRHEVHRRVAHGRNRGTLQADPVEQHAQFAIVVRRPLENRNLDAVVAGRLDVLEQPAVSCGDVRRPQEHAKADLHVCLPDLAAAVRQLSKTGARDRIRPATFVATSSLLAP